MDFFDILLAKKLEDDRDPTIEGLSVTENGTYSEENKAYNPVIVEVPEPTLITKSITANGTYTASADNADGYSSVTVAVEGFKKKSIANTPTDIASFNDGTANPMPSLEISIEPVQDLHGYDNPWVGGAGKNLLNIPDSAPQTTNGVTWRFENGLLYINGTCTGGFLPLTVSVIYPSDTYTFSAQILGGTMSGANNRLNGYDSDNKRIWLTAFGINGVSVSNTQTDDINLITLNINKNAIFNNAIIGFQVERGSSMTSYEPYSNICPISGWSGANVTVADDLTTPTETHTTTIPFHDSSDNPITVYGGTLNVTSGELTATHANIASYNGETINEPWISSMDVYSAGATPTTGAQVVYPLATPQTYQLTPAQVSTLLGQNNIFADCGQILEGEYFVTL